MQRKPSILNIIIFIISIGAGTITIGLVIVLCKEYSVFNGQLKIQDTGNVGDFFGGVVGSLIGLISVLLLYKTLRYQQKDIESNELSNRLQWSTGLLMKLIDDLKDKNSFRNIEDLNSQLNESEFSFEFVKRNIELLTEVTNQLDLEFNVINKLIYQEKFQVFEMNLLRLITYNHLGNKFFKFISDLDYFVTHRNHLKTIENETDLILAYQKIHQNLIKPLNNLKQLNESEILEIINNYKAEDNLKEIRLEDWLKITGKIKKG